MPRIVPFGRNSWCCEALQLCGLYHYCFTCRALLVGVASSSGARSLLPRSLGDDLEQWERLYGASFYRVGGQ